MRVKTKKSKHERVIYLWSVPANGHLNPTLCFTNQLLLRLDELNVSKIVFYSGTSFKDRIDNLPNNLDRKRIEFRDYGLQKHTGSEDLLKIIMDFDTRPGNLFRMFQCFENSVKLGSKHLFKRLIQDIHKDKPVLILYDQALFFPKLALDLYAKKYNRPKPLHACYVTTFMCAKGIYPYWSELEKMGLLGKNDHVHDKIRIFGITLYDFCKYVFTYYKTLWWDLGFTLIDLFLKCDLPISKYHLIDDNLNLVFVMPELQPRLKYFEEQENIKFVGPSVDEGVRRNILKEKRDMDKYVRTIDEFLEKNALKDINDNKQAALLNQSNISLSNSLGLDTENVEEQFRTLLRSESTGENFRKLFKPIIYVSMGTVFNNENSTLFKILVEACKNFSDKYAVIVSTGDEKTYEIYANTSLNSGNILMVPHTPQVEILKRAHLFITHAGMNSVSEAINYGVPIICLPLSGDQPFVAWRVADELQLGIRLQPDETLTIETVKQSIQTILSDPGYRKRAQDYSALSKRYAGHKEACELIVDFIKAHDAKQNLKHKIGDSILIVPNEDPNSTIDSNLVSKPELPQHAQSLNQQTSCITQLEQEVNKETKTKKKRNFPFSFSKKK